jgi:hypothetical protein
MSEAKDDKPDVPPTAEPGPTPPPRKYEEECEDPELEDLLQSTLHDFETKPVLASGGGVGGASAGGGGTREDDPDWDEEKFIKDATGHFEQSMRALLAASSGVAGDAGVAEAEMSKVMTGSDPSGSNHGVKWSSKYPTLRLQI